MYPEGRQRSDTRARQIFGCLLLIAATSILLIGYRSAPDVNTCYPINLAHKEAGLPRGRCCAQRGEARPRAAGGLGWLPLGSRRAWKTPRRRLRWSASTE